MSLGLIAKDSMVNLAELAFDKEEGESEPSTLARNVPPGNDLLVQVLPKEDVGAGAENGEGDSESTDGREPPGGGRSNGNDQSIMRGPLSDNIATQKQHHIEQENPNINLGESKALTSQTSTAAAMGSKNDVASNGSNASVESELSDDAKLAAAKVVGQYSGFSADYHEFENFAYHTSYRNYGNTVAGGNLVALHLNSSYREEVPWWCCFFPWITGEKMIEDDASSLPDPDSIQNSSVGQESSQNVEDNGQQNFSRSSSKEDDEISTGSDVFGEKLSEKDKQAVLARLRLVQPEPFNATQSEASNSTSGPNPKIGTNLAGMKSILKRSSTTVSNSNLALDRMAQSSRRQGSESGPRRRSLFPTYETKAPAEKKNLHPHFAPMARVVTIKSHNDMQEQEKARIWWQKPDYEEFRKTGRMITKVMLEGGSEIWLATNQSWQMPNQGKAQTLQCASSLADRHAAFKKGDLKAKHDYEDTRDKWWHKFGHSRRGLEHIASIDEGRQRQANVKTSIKAVLEEQRRQKAFHREDPEKLRMVSIQNTAWARDLALASGASDADAVQTNFDDESRRTREFYLLKFSRANQSNNMPATSKKVVPAFMKPMMTMQIRPNRLDANTMTQVRYRQTQQQTDNAFLKRSTSELQDARVPIRDEDGGHGGSHSTLAKKGRCCEKNRAFVCFMPFSPQGHFLIDFFSVSSCVFLIYSRRLCERRKYWKHVCHSHRYGWDGSNVDGNCRWSLATSSLCVDFYVPINHRKSC
jgi:hypothetical protein